MSEDIQALLVRLEANATKMISETRKASKTVSDELRKIDNEFRRSNQNVTDGLTRKGRQMKDSADQYRNVGFAAQNAAFQVGDFFTQVAGGTAPTRALAQQLPQLLGGLGLIGALSGAAAAALIPLAGNLLSTGEAGDSAEKAVQELGKSIDDYQRYIQVAAMSTAELTAKFGDFAGEVRAFSEYMAGVALADTIDGLQATVGALQGPLTGVQKLVADAQMLEEQMQRLQEQEAQGMGIGMNLLAAQDAFAGARDNAEAAASALGLTVEQALELSSAIEAVGRATSMEELAVASGEALAFIREIVPLGYELPAPLRESVAALEEIQRRAAEANVDLSSMPDILASVASGASAAASGVAGIGTAAAGALGPLQALAEKAWEAAQARIAAVNNLQSLSMEFSPAGQAMAKYGGRGTPSGTGEPKPVSSGRDGGGGGGGASADPQDFLQQRIDLAQRAAEAAQLEARAIMMTAEAAAREKAKLDLLNEAKRQKLDLDKQNTASGLTLRQEIDRQADAIGRLAVQTDKYRERTQFAQENVQTLKDGFLDAIVEGENLSGTLEKLAKSLARAALEAAFFGSGPFAGGGSGGGGGILGGLLGGIFGGFRAEGGPVQAGRAYVVGEEGPELMVPRSSGMIIPNGGGKGGGVTLSVSIDARGAQMGVAEQIDARMRQILPQIVRQSVQGVKVSQKKGY